MKTCMIIMNKLCESLWLSVFKMVQHISEGNPKEKDILLILLKILLLSQIGFEVHKY